MSGILLVRDQRVGYNETRMAETHLKDPFRIFFLILLGSGVLSVCYIIASGQEKRSRQQSQIGGTSYQADQPLSQPLGELMSGMILLRPEQMSIIPMADGFQWYCWLPKHGHDV